MLKFIAFVLLCNSFLFSQLRLGLDISGDVKVAWQSVSDLDGSSDTYAPDKGIIIGYDYLTKEQDQLHLGIGGEYMIGREAEESHGKLSFHSIYGFGKYAIDDKLYGLARLGYNIHTGDDEYRESIPLDGGSTTLKHTGGMMYSFGGGYSLTPNINIEALHSSHAGKSTFSGSAVEALLGDDLVMKINYTRLTVAIVYTK